MIQILLIQLFWGSFFIVGLGVLLVAHHFSEKLRLHNFFKFFKTIHPFAFWLITTALGFSLFSLYVVPGYFLRWPFILLKVVYILALIASLVGLWVRRNMCLNIIKKVYKEYRKDWAWLMVVAAVIFIYYIISLKHGAPVYGDGRYFIGKVTQLSEGGKLTFLDPNFSRSGVVNPAYSANLLIALQALGTNLLGVSALTMWFYSGAFHLLLIATSIFSLCWFFVEKRERNIWSYIVLMLLPVLYLHMFRFIESELPHCIALAWIALLIVGLKILFDYKTSVIFYLAVFLVALTHSLNAAMVTGFLIMLLFGLGLTKSLHKKLALILLSGIILSVLPVLFALHFPSYVETNPMQFYSGEGDFTYHKLGSLLFQLPPRNIYPVFITSVVYVIMGAYLLFARKIPKVYPRVLIHCLLTIAFALVYDARFVSLIGCAYIIHYSKNRASKVMILLLMAYYALTMYNPVVLTLTKGHVPYWAFLRFADFNMLGFITPIVGLLFVTQWPLRVWGYKKVAYSFYIVVPTLFLFLIPLVFPQVVAIGLKTGIVARSQTDQLNYLSFLEKNKDLLKDQVIYATDPDVTRLISDVTTANMLTIPVLGAPPMANSILRDKCAENIKHHLDPRDLDAAGVSLILVDHQNNSEFDELARTKPFLHLLRESEGYSFYKVTSPENMRANAFDGTPCAIPYGE